jgi:hypothetical protein
MGSKLTKHATAAALALATCLGAAFVLRADPPA